MEDLSVYTAFDGSQVFCRGSLDEVVLKIKKKLGKSENNPILIFSDSTGKSMDFNFQGTEKEVLKRLEVYVSEGIPKESVGPGRPKLGVVSREISLLPRHWEWLATQTGGASVTLRRLIEDAKKRAGSNPLKLAQERTYRFMSVMAGDREGYEEALRALYKNDLKKFANLIQGWPKAIQKHLLELSRV